MMVVSRSLGGDCPPTHAAAEPAPAGLPSFARFFIEAADCRLPMPLLSWASCGCEAGLSPLASLESLGEKPGTLRAS